MRTVYDAVMSIPVPLAELAGEVGKRGPGYLLTTTADSRPHVMHLRLTVKGTELRSEVGRSATRNIVAQPAVTLLWPAVEDGGLSLIVDGTATIVDAATAEGAAVAVISATGAVLHRPA